MNNETKSLVFLWSRISIGTAILMKREFGNDLNIKYFCKSLK